MLIAITRFLFFFVIIKYKRFFMVELKFVVLLENYPHNCRSNYNSIDSLCLARSKRTPKVNSFLIFIFTETNKHAGNNLQYNPAGI